MHQHPRSPAPSAPSGSTTRPRSSRAQDAPGSPTFDMRLSNSRGLGIESVPDSPEQGPAPSKDVMAKLNQIISVCFCLSTHGKEKEKVTDWLMIVPELPYESNSDHSSRPRGPTSRI